ncbi:MAG: nucleotidyltransferase [Pseudomonadota bacterium]
MEIQQDFKELLELFNAHKVKYLIVGGYALAFHGAPRYTGDIDIYVKPDAENAKHILNALEEFGFGSAGLMEEDLKTLNKVVQLGFPPVRIDIITSISGVSWDDAFKKHEEGVYGDIPVYYIGKEHYVINKRASGRRKDLADLEALGEE